MDVFRMIFLFMPSLPEPRILQEFLQIKTAAVKALYEVNITASDEVNQARIIQSLSKRILGYLNAFQSPPANNFNGQSPRDIFRTSWSVFSMFFSSFQRRFFVFRHFSFVT